MKAVEHWACITGAPVLVMHRENAVFKVETKSGFAALRIHRPGYHSRIEIESELHWMNHLARSGLNVPTPLLNQQGNFVAQVKDSTVYHVDLLSWLDGTPLGKSRVPLEFTDVKLSSIFFALGCVLARMHTASDQWSPPTSFKRHALDSEGLLGDHAAWGCFWEADCLSPIEKQLLRNARDLSRQKLDSLKRSGADYGLIHADLVRENILLSDQQVQVIDFDDAGFGFRMYDLATALVKNRDEPHYEIIKHQLFSGYKSQRALSPSDESTLDLFLTLRDFAYLGWADARAAQADIAARLPQIRTDTLKAAEAFLKS